MAEWIGSSTSAFHGSTYSCPASFVLTELYCTALHCGGGSTHSGSTGGISTRRCTRPTGARNTEGEGTAEAPHVPPAQFMIATHTTLPTTFAHALSRPSTSTISYTTISLSYHLRLSACFPSVLLPRHDSCHCSRRLSHPYRTGTGYLLLFTGASFISLILKLHLYWVGCIYHGLSKSFGRLYHIDFVYIPGFAYFCFFKFIWRFGAWVRLPWSRLVPVLVCLYHLYTLGLTVLSLGIRVPYPMVCFLHRSGGLRLVKNVIEVVRSTNIRPAMGKIRHLTK